VSFKVIVAGSRTFEDDLFMASVLDHLLARKLPDVTIISGCAPGADTLGEGYARKRGLACERMPADWSKGKGAGPRRNQEMVDVAQAAVFFWDGSSRGTADCIRRAEAAGLQVRVIKVRVD
jgi:hypothetical protein